MLLQHYHTFTNLVTILVLRPTILQKVLSFALGNSLNLMLVFSCTPLLSVPSPGGSAAEEQLLSCLPAWLVPAAAAIQLSVFSETVANHSGAITGLLSKYQYTQGTNTVSLLQILLINLHSNSTKYHILARLSQPR